MLQRVAGILLVVSALGAAPPSERLKVGFGHVPPMSYVDQNGRPAGFAVDVLNEAARREGIQLDWVRSGTSLDIENDLQRGALDLVPAGTVTRRRLDLFYVSEPWWSAELYALTRKSSGIYGAPALRGKRLALASPIYGPIAERSLPPLIQIPETSAVDAIKRVCRGEADAALLTQVAMEENALARPEACRDVDLRAFETTGKMDLAVIARRGVEPAARRLRNRVDDMALDGRLATMATWHPPTPTSGAVQLAATLRARYRYRTMAISLLSALSLLAIGAAFVMRQRKTSRALRHKSELLQSVVDTIPLMIAIYDPAHKHFTLNREFTRVLGWSEEDARAGLMEACYPDPAVRRQAAEFMNSGAPGWHDFSIAAKDGGAVESSWANIRLSDSTQVGIGIDLRDRLRAEHELRDSYRRFATLVENIPDIVYRLDRALKCVYVNAAARNRGLVAHESARQDDFEITWPAGVRERIEAECREVLRTGAPRQFEAMVEGRHERMRVVPESGEDGAVASLLVIAEDVTEARRIERSLRDSENRWALAVEYAGLGLWDFDLRTRKAVWTRRQFEVLGYEPDSFEPTEEIWRSRIHPEDRDRVLAAVESARREHSLYSCLHRVVRADNSTVVWLDAYGRFEYDGDDATRFIGVFVDVTQRKRSEAEVAAIMDAVPAAIFIARDPECGHITGNRMTYDLFRAPAGSNLAAAPALLPAPAQCRLLREGRELQPQEMPVQVAASTGEPVRDYEFDLICEDGTTHRLFGNAVPLLDESGRPRGSVAAFTDVTELKRMEERLRDSQKLESIGLLAGGIAHDFNNILVSVVGNASLALDILPDGSPVRELLDQVIAGGEQASHLTRQMLAYAGKGRFFVERVNVAEIARETVMLVQPSISKKVAVRLDLAPELPVVEADRSQIQQVLMNLVLNAAEAIGDKAGLITVRVGPGDLDGNYLRRELAGYDIKPGRYVALEVRDTGSGMDAATKARIFDPFFTTKFTGRGLGLAAVAGIVRAHHGAIVVDTAPGQGSSFVVFFPATIPADRPAAARSTASADLSGSGTVLVVDDEETVRDTVARALAVYGYTVLLAADGPSAIDLFRKEAPGIALVILDLSMPGMSGEEVLPELQKIRPDVRVLVSSGYSEVEALRLFAGLTVAGFLQKPYKSRDLAEKVKAVIVSRKKASQG